MNRILLSVGLAVLVAITSVALPGFLNQAVASEIRYIVNGVPITSYDIQRRAAFLKLQRRKGDINKMAADEMINQTLHIQEARRLNVRISDQAVNEAYVRFVKSNKLTPAQMDQILNQAGVTPAHFKAFIGSQMAWSQAISARERSGNGTGGKLTERDIVRKMLEKGGGKPTATEYMLQQVIFVVPEGERAAILGKRKREAEAMRGRFTGCAEAKQFAKGLLDVTVRDLGRVLALELPPDWADAVKATKVGGATPVRETPRGVEFIGVCSTREVSDDKVAKLVFQNEGNTIKSEDSDALSKKYTEELRERATITTR